LCFITTIVNELFALPKKQRLTEQRFQTTTSTQQRDTACRRFIPYIGLLLAVGHAHVPHQRAILGGARAGPCAHDKVFHSERLNWRRGAAGRSVRSSPPEVAAVFGVLSRIIVILL